MARPTAGWNVAPRIDRPSVTPIQTPPAKPTTGATGPAGPEGPQGPKGDPGDNGKDAADEAILLALFQRIKADPAFKGPKGDPGIAPDVDDIAAAVISKMPPTTVDLMDGNGDVHERLTFPFGQPIQLPPTLVRRFARDGKTVLDVEAYPLGTHINMRFGAEVIPATEVR